MVNRGPLGRPTRVLSFTDYERTFGDNVADSEMTDQVRQFFLNGGQQAFIMRIANGAVASAISLQSEFGTTVLDLVARDAGIIGDTIRVEIDYNTSSPEATFNLTAYRLESNASGAPTHAGEEVFAELTMDPASARYAVTILRQQSKLLDVPATYNPAAANGTRFNGYAIAGALGTDAELATAVETAIPAGESRDFRISVDGGPFVTVTLAQADVAGAGVLAALLQGAINNQLLSFGTSVTVNVISNHLVIASATSGGSVRLRQGTTAIVADALQLGLDRGALEVDGYAAARPAPNGVFQDLDALSNPNTVVTALDDLGTSAPADIDGYELVDTFGTHTQGAIFTYAGATLREDAAGNESLGQLQASLDQIVTQINADAAADDLFSWEVERVGFRLRLRPVFGDSDTSATSLATTPNDIGFTLGVAAYRLNAAAGLPFQTNPVAGDDGIAPLAEDYDDAYITVDREVDLFNLMILPRASGQGDDDLAELHGPASVFCQQRRAFLIVDPRQDWITADDVDGGIVDARIGVVTDHAAIYWPRLAISANGVIRFIDPSGSIAGLMARTDSSRGVWKAPAGTEATIRGVRGLQHALSDAENGLINPQAVNALRIFPAGVVSWGARTMVGFNNSGNDDYKYVPVRRLALFLEESLYRGLQFAVFEPNDEPLWAQIRLAAGAFMNNLFRQGAFQGQKSSDAYFVKVDSETTTQNDINLGIVNVVIGFAPLKPAEFVIITLQQRAGEVSV
jgi:phage tail sheath protein FI